MNDPFFLRGEGGDITPECLKGVVGVHDWVDHVVHHHEPSNIGSEVAEAVKDGYEDAEVVVPEEVKNTLAPVFIQGDIS